MVRTQKQYMPMYMFVRVARDPNFPGCSNCSFFATKCCKAAEINKPFLNLLSEMSLFFYLQDWTGGV